MTGDSRAEGLVRKAGPPPAKIQSHRDLVVWQKAMHLVDRIYDIVEAFPGREMYGLSSQITRAAVSVATNIAEGHVRSTRRDFANFLAIARGSLMETETLLTVAVRRGYVSEPQAGQALSQIAEVSKMLTSLRSRIASTGGKD